MSTNEPTAEHPVEASPHVAPVSEPDASAPDPQHPEGVEAAPRTLESGAADGLVAAGGGDPPEGAPGSLVWEEEEGDDVGNRVGAAAGGAPHPAPSPGGEEKKGKRRRRRKDGAEGRPEGEAQAAPQGGEGESRRKPPAERPAFSVGDDVFGKVVRITDDAIWVDIAGKAIGLFDRRDVAEGEALPSDGDPFLATVASTGVRGGMLVLSRKLPDLDASRQALEAAQASGEPASGLVTGAIKGGLEVDFGGVRAFAPASHVDLRPGGDLSHWVGQRLDFQIIQYARKGRDVVASRRKQVEGDAQKARTEAASALVVGNVYKGTVRSVLPWGAFVALPDAGGAEGVVHMTEASHDRGARMQDLFKPGEEIEVKVLRLDERGKISLSRKAAVADPWQAVRDKYALWTRHKAKVVRLQPFGAFVELEPGVDGLIHAADLSFKPIEHPSEVVKVGDELDVVVSNVDSAQRRIALHPAPPAAEEGAPRPKLAVGKLLKVAVVQVTDGGLVVRIVGATGRNARGFVPASHTGVPKGGDLRKEFPLAKALEVKVIEIDKRGEARLSVRALREDAEKAAYQEYRAGVARDAKFGTFGDLFKGRIQKTS